MWYDPGMLRYSLSDQAGGLETEAFIDHYENHHVPLVLASRVRCTSATTSCGDEFNRDDAAIDFES